MLPAACLSALLSSLVSLPFAAPWSASPLELVDLALFGISNMGLGLILFMIGARLIPATQTALIGALDAPLAPARFDMVTPHVQLYGDAAIVTYTRLMSYFDDGRPRTTTANETRIYIQQEGAWRMVHFHRSPTR